MSFDIQITLCQNECVNTFYLVSQIFKLMLRGLIYARGVRQLIHQLQYSDKVALWVPVQTN